MQLCRVGLHDSIGRSNLRSKLEGELHSSVHEEASGIQIANAVEKLQDSVSFMTWHYTETDHPWAASAVAAAHGLLAAAHA